MVENQNIKSVVIILTCYNRKEKTIKCIKTLYQYNKSINIEFVVVDDNSTDGTVEEMQELQNIGYRIHLIHGDGSLYYSGGMRKGMCYVLKHIKADYCLLVNDDVEFYENCIIDLISACNDEVVVGPTCGKQNNLTYSGIRYTQGIHYKKVSIEDLNRTCDTFNANCVLIPYYIFARVPVMDQKYKHSLGDFDYGLSLKHSGNRIVVLQKYIGVCENNPSTNTWLDTSLSMQERIRKKEHVKGAPTREWFYFLHKNFGLLKALIYSVTPYIRIFLRK